jgi:Ca2+/H+ antiporter
MGKDNLYKIFNIVFALFVGIFFMFFRPISRNGDKRFKIFENIISIIVLICGVGMMVEQILGK